MSDMKKRLLNLGISEGVAALVFLAIHSIYFVTEPASRVALYFLVFLLAQGSLYWFYKFRTLGKNPSPVVRKTYSLLRIMNLVLAALVIIAVFALARNRTDLIASLLIFAFAVIEYVNYYWYRLSYGKSGFHLHKLAKAGFKPSSMRRFLKKSKSG